MNQEKYGLQELGEATLQAFASLICGRSVRVMFSDRLEAPAAVVFHSTTLVLNPRRCQLLDVIILAVLLERRGEARKRLARRKRLPAATAADWVKAAVAETGRRYPRTKQLTGLLNSAVSGRDLPDLTWKEAKVRPLSRADMGTADGELSQVPGLEWVGAQGDVDELLHAIDDGRYPLRECAELGLPVATVPLRLVHSDAHDAFFEEMERIREEKQAIAEQFMRCFTRKAMAREDYDGGRHHLHAGAELDHQKLVEAEIARRVGIVARPFVRRDADFHRQFAPEQHLVMHGLSLDCVEGPGRLGRPKWNTDALVMTFWMYKALGVHDFGCVVFGDRIVTLPSGRPTYLLIPIVIKHPTRDSFDDGSVWARLAHVVKGKLNLSGELACHSPLQLEHMIGVLTANAQPEHRYQTLLYLAPYGMGDHAFPSCPTQQENWSTAEYHERTAATLNKQLQQVADRQADDFWLDADFLWLPHDLIDHARRGSWIARAQTL